MYAGFRVARDLHCLSGLDRHDQATSVTRPFLCLCCAQDAGTSVEEIKPFP